jgi:hypothetical protein
MRGIVEVMSSELRQKGVEESVFFNGYGGKDFVLDS